MRIQPLKNCARMFGDSLLGFSAEYVFGAEKGVKTGLYRSQIRIIRRNVATSVRHMLEDACFYTRNPRCCVVVLIMPSEKNSNDENLLIVRGKAVAREKKSKASRTSVSVRFPKATRTSARLLRCRKDATRVSFYSRRGKPSTPQLSARWRLPNFAGNARLATDTEKEQPTHYVSAFSIFALGATRVAADRSPPTENTIKQCSMACWTYQQSIRGTKTRYRPALAGFRFLFCPFVTHHVEAGVRLFRPLFHADGEMRQKLRERSHRLHTKENQENTSIM